MSDLEKPSTIMISFSNWQQMIRPCVCGAETNKIQFLRGTKTGETIDSHIISCGVCGKYVVDHDNKLVMLAWNRNENLLQAEVI